MLFAEIFFQLHLLQPLAKKNLEVPRLNFGSVLPSFSYFHHSMDFQKCIHFHSKILYFEEVLFFNYDLSLLAFSIILHSKNIPVHMYIHNCFLSTCLK